MVVADAARAAHVAQHLSDGDEAFANRRLLDFLRRDNAPWRRDVQKRRTVLRKALLEDEDRRRKLKKRKASTSANWACIRIVTHAQLLESRDVLGDARPDRIILVDVCFEAVRRIEAGECVVAEKPLVRWDVQVCHLIVIRLQLDCN